MAARVYNRYVDATQTDESLAVERACEGDKDAFGWLVERYQEAAFRAAYLIVRDAQAAEDVAQESFVRAYGQLHRFRREDPFRPWLLRITQNLALNHLRSQKRRAAVVERAAVFADRESPEPHGEVAAADRAATVLRAIDELPEDDRVVLHLRWFMELPEREIAAAIGKPPGTVKSRLHRAGQRLRGVIEEKYPGLREASDA